MSKQNGSVNGTATADTPATLFAVLAFHDGVSIETPGRVLFLDWRELAGLADERGTPTHDESGAVPVLGWPAIPQFVSVRDVTSPEA